MSRQSRFRSRSFRQRLLGAASYGCLVACFAHAQQAVAQDGQSGSFYDGLAISVEGGFLINDSPHNMGLTQSDVDFSGGFRGLPSLHPGHDGASAGLSLMQPIDSHWDWKLGWRYSWLGTKSFSGPAVTGGADPGTGSISDRLTFQTIDPEFGYHLPMMSGIDLRLFAGPRVLNVNNRVAYGIDESDKLGSYDHRSQLWGAGPRVGLQASIPSTSWPVSLDLPLSLNLMGAGAAIFSNQRDRFDYSYSGTDTGGGNPKFDNAPTIYNLEGSIGIGYKICDPLTLTVGYRAQQFWHAVPNFTGIDAFGDVELKQTNILVHGPFARFTVTLP
jgi:hypothetical protein